MLCVNEFNVNIAAVLNVLLRLDNFVLVMIVRLGEKTMHTK